MTTSTTNGNNHTSGQKDALLDLLSPYQSFPSHITGPTVWTADEYQNNPEKWVIHWTEDQLSDITAAIVRFKAAGWKLTEMTKERFPLSHGLEKLLLEVRRELIDGRGFVLFRGFPVNKWLETTGSHEWAAIGYMGLGSHIGPEFVTQNRYSHLLGHVKDVTEGTVNIATTRIYRTTLKQFFHTDACDIVGLLCLAKALEGGASGIVSSHHLYNILRKERPDVLEILSQPWYWDRKGELSSGDQEWTVSPIFMYYDNHIHCHLDPYFYKSLSRFWEKGILPPLTDKQLEALDVLEETAERESLRMTLEVGDMQLLANYHVLHSRTEFKDYPPPHPRRHLLRLWLSTPVVEGGWRIPFPFSDERKRGGINIDRKEEICPLDADWDTKL